MSGWLHTPSGALTLPCRHYFIKDLFRRRESFRSSLFQEVPKRLKGLRERAPFQNRLRKLRKRAGSKAEGSSNLQVSPPLHQAGVTSEQVSPSNIPMKHSFVLIKAPFFPRASERRVLPIVGVCKTSSHLLTSSHIFSHLLTSSHIFSHLLTSSHIFLSSSHIFSHLLTSTHIFSHLLTSFSHLLTSSHIFSHLLTSSHIFSHLLTSSHIFSHLLTSSPLALLPSCTSSHIFSHLLTSSHTFSHLLPSCPLALLPSCLLALSFFSISLLKVGAGAVATRRHETQPFRTK